MTNDSQTGKRNEDNDFLSTNNLLFTDRRKWVTVILLMLINVLNYADRFIIAALGQLQTVFFVFYTLLCPLSGFLGDRWKRKYIMLIGLSLWVIITFFSSFIPSKLFHLFLASRCLVGIGEASYSTIAPTLISDLFVGDKRTLVLGLFYFTVPVGSGMGFIFGSVVTRLTGHWQWALRITPMFGFVAIVIFAIFHKDPPRGEAEGASHMRSTSWVTDIKDLFSNTAFMLINAAFTCVSFSLGALTWFAVDLVQSALSAKYVDPNAWRSFNVPIIFGISACLAGICGVLSGTIIGQYMRRWIPAADAFVCGISLFVCAPVLYITLLSPSWNFYLCIIPMIVIFLTVPLYVAYPELGFHRHMDYLQQKSSAQRYNWASSTAGAFKHTSRVLKRYLKILVFAVQFLLCITWGLVSDMSLCVVIPTRRSSASALQSTMAHALGDAISPAIIGQIAVAISDSSSLEMKYLSLQRALFLTPFICVLGGFLFFCVSEYLIKAKIKVQMQIGESLLIEEELVPSASSPQQSSVINL